MAYFTYRDLLSTQESCIFELSSICLKYLMRIIILDFLKIFDENISKIIILIQVKCT